MVDLDSSIHEGEVSLGASIRQVRLRKQLTVEELARASGLSVALISKIERGLGNPSINSLRQIAKALGVPTAFFFARERDGQDDKVAHNSKRVYAYPQSRVTYTATVSPISDDVKFLMIEALPGAEGGTEAICHQGFEQGMVVEGELELTVGDRTFVLKPLDTISFPSTIPHRWVNKGDVPCRSIWAIAINHPLGAFSTPADSDAEKAESETAAATTAANPATPCVDAKGQALGRLRHRGEEPKMDISGADR